ncbi:MAG: hypothetical protein AAB370_11050 [Verrucomicrobiota bacterium]
MAIELTIKKVGTEASVTVSLNVSRAEQPIEFKNTAMASVPCMDFAVSSEAPFLTYAAIESACNSGAIYARRKLKVEGVVVELLHFSWGGKVENAEPFAVAVMLAICSSLGKETAFTESELCGWRLASE